MAGVYRPRHPERTVLYRVLFHYFDRFLAEYESRVEKEYGYFRPIIKEVTACHHEAWKAVVISWMRGIAFQEVLMAAETGAQYFS